MKKNDEYRDCWKDSSQSSLSGSDERSRVKKNHAHKHVHTRTLASSSRVSRHEAITRNTVFFFLFSFSSLPCPSCPSLVVCINAEWNTWERIESRRRYRTKSYERLSSHFSTTHKNTFGIIDECIVWVCLGFRIIIVCTSTLCESSGNTQ